jgi:hypothetical protein
VVGKALQVQALGVDRLIDGPVDFGQAAECRELLLDPREHPHELGHVVEVGVVLVDKRGRGYTLKKKGVSLFHEQCLELLARPLPPV